MQRKRDLTGKQKRLAEFRDLARRLAEVRSAGEMEDFMFAILTPAERARIALRWELLKLLVSGVSQRRIARMLGVSLCKITRGSRELQRGPVGFRNVVRRAVPPGSRRGT